MSSLSNDTSLATSREDSIGSFCVKLLTSDRQTDRQTVKRWIQHYLLGGNTNNTDDIPMVNYSKLVNNCVMQMYGN